MGIFNRKKKAKSVKAHFAKASFIPLAVVSTAIIAEHGGETARADTVDQLASSAVPVANNYGLYPSVMIAQAILESDYGRSTLASQYNNYFGVKYTNGEGIDLPTQEYENGEMGESLEKFQIYDDPTQSFESQAQLLRSDFYSGAWRENAANYQEATAALQGKYATDPNYAQMLNAIIEDYQLTAYDAEESNPTKDLEGTNAQSQYEVAAGDSLLQIAEAANMSVDALASLNGLNPGDTIQIGQRLTVGTETSTNNSVNNQSISYQVVAGDTLSSIAKSQGTTVEHLQEVNGLSPTDLLTIDQILEL